MGGDGEGVRAAEGKVSGRARSAAVVPAAGRHRRAQRTASAGPAPPPGAPGVRVLANQADQGGGGAAQQRRLHCLPDLFGIQRRRAAAAGGGDSRGGWRFSMQTGQVHSSTQELAA